MSESLSAAGKALSASLTRSSGGDISINISTDNVGVAGLLCIGATAVTLGAIYAGYQLYSKKIDGAVNRGLGGNRDDQEIRGIRPGSLHVLLHCFTDERFLEVIADYETGSMKERLQYEFTRAGIEVEGLKVEIENMEEVYKTKEVINNRRPVPISLANTIIPSSSHLSSGKMAGIHEIFIPVPQEYMGRVEGAQGSNIKQLQQQTQTSIRSRNANANENESGFIVTGSLVNCHAACRSIKLCVENMLMVTINELVPQQYVRLVTRSIREIEGKCGVKITWPKFSGEEEHVMFNIKGSRANCENAQAMLKAKIENMLMVTINELVPQQYVRLVTRCFREIEEKCGVKITWPKFSGEEEHVMFSIKGSRANCESAREMLKAKIPLKQNVERKFSVRKKYLPVILGPSHKNKESIETKSNAKIKLQKRSETEAILIITGEEQDCVRAIWLIRKCIIAHNEGAKAKGLGGINQFVWLVVADEKSEFLLTQENRAKLDSFIKGPRYRIETEGDCIETEVSDEMISQLKQHLLTSLNKLQSFKDEKELMIDLWCRFGKVFVHNVDEEEVKGAISLEYINKRIQKIFSPEKRTEKDSSWRVSFEEGVDPSLINKDALPKFGDEDEDFFHLKLLHTQWCYEFGFITASDRNVRLKAWDGLPFEANEPPVEVMSILTSVDIHGKGNIKAWICYPSTTVLSGDLITPDLPYDCRMKLRAGTRYVIDKDKVCEEEDRILSDFLSDCSFDAAGKYRISLPDAEMPDGFECTFYRESEERIFSATVDGQCFTVIVLQQKGWDSDSSSKRVKDQFGIRVVMNSWFEALLCHERRWKTEEILDKLKAYMDFLSLLKSHLFLSDDR